MRMIFGKNSFAVIRALFVFMLCTVLPFSSFGQQSESSVKAGFLYNFTKFVEWPSNPKIYTICVIQDNDVLYFLKEIKKQLLERVDLEIVDKKSNSDFSECHILYIGNISQEIITKTVMGLSGRPMLIVSSVQGFARSGGMIGLVKEKGKINLEYNRDVTKKSGLVIDSELAELMRPF